MKSIDNTLAVKALNQYRKRDLIAYLNLRYYLESSVAKKSQWIKEISTNLATEGESGGFLKTIHFKDYLETGEIIHRVIYVPTPNESLAETALITELSIIDAFKAKPFVFSYRFTKQDDKSGAFKQYFNGFKQRQESIGDACKQVEDGVVLFTDIKKFYPSITSEDALRVWNQVSSNSSLSIQYCDLGRTLLKNQKERSELDNSSRGLLTGPQLSHVIANLLLDEMDTMLFQVTKGNYWRYVDDIVFVGKKDEVIQWRKALKKALRAFGLELHTGDKDFEVSCAEWLTGEHDFEQNIGNSWISFIADTKRFLLSNPSKYKELERSYINHNIRLPLRDYSQAVQESSYLHNFQFWLKRYSWSKGAVKKIGINYLVQSASLCKKSLLEDLDIQLQSGESETMYQRKRKIPKLRYLAGRLLFLLNNTELVDVSIKLDRFSELRLISSVMKAVATRDISEILAMGTNAMQSAAQLLRLSVEPVSFDRRNVPKVSSDVIRQSMAILSFSGIKSSSDLIPSELLDLAEAEGISSLMSSEDKFVREFACLHGNYPARHATMLDTAFDKDEELALDVLNHLSQSSHC